MRAFEGSKVVSAVGDPVCEVESCVVGVGGEGGLVGGESGEELLFRDLVPLSTRGVAEEDVFAGGEDRVERVSGDVGGGVHQLFEAEVGEVVEQGGGVGVVVLFQMEVEVA
ncbi:hypothetical protein NDU88_005623 [Pleurodeles waltl]|uniref:Uncharacterized protein n=1 Tax=Pleurodeles waltl TaxID=8319 RepID=A0AAV7NST1_PLEWA|nr:hypothetical protein NDU88_005623 [Pleurodeles waltl]